MNKGYHIHYYGMPMYGYDDKGRRYVYSSIRSERYKTFNLFSPYYYSIIKKIEIKQAKAWLKKRKNIINDGFVKSYFPVFTM